MKELKAGDECPICKEGKLNLHTKNLTLRYKGHTKELCELKVLRCGECEEGFYLPESEKVHSQGFADFRRQVDGLLTSSEIKNIRSRYRLTQEQLSCLLGMALKTVARYENGTIIQSASTDLLLRLIDDHPMVIHSLSKYTSVELPSQWEIMDKKIVQFSAYRKVNASELLHSEEKEINDTLGSKPTACAA